MADLQKTSQVVGQVEWKEDSTDAKQLLSQIVGQVEYVDTDDLPPPSKGVNILIIT